MLERRLRLAFASYSTLFLLAAVITLPVHIGLAAAFKDEIAVRNLAPEIENFPKTRQVHGVGKIQLRNYATAYWVVTLGEILALPLLAGMARKAMETDAKGGVSTLPGSRRGGAPLLKPSASAAETAAAFVIAVAVVWLCRQIGMLLVEPVGPQASWVAVGTVEGVARAAGAPFFFAAWTRTSGFSDLPAME